MMKKSGPVKKKRKTPSTSILNNAESLNAMIKYTNSIDQCLKNAINMIQKPKDKSVPIRFMSLYKKLFNSVILKSIAGMKLKLSDRSMNPGATQLLMKRNRRNAGHQ